MTIKNIKDEYRRLSYPPDADQGGDIPYIVFYGKPYFTPLNSAATASPENNSVIKIAIPPSLTSNDSFNYDTTSMLKSAAVVEQVAQGNYASAGESLLQGLMADLPGGQESADVFAALSGRQINPKEKLLFKAPSLRTHTFTFNMFARNQSEAQTIANIILAFRKMAYPTTGTITETVTSGFVPTEGGTVYNFPYEFRIAMFPSPNNGFPNIPRAFCTSIDTNYAGSGRVTMTTDNYFQSVDLTLTFQDIELLNDSNINQLD